jgi:hypothetical protein
VTVLVLLLTERHLCAAVVCESSGLLQPPVGFPVCDWPRQ